METVRRYDLDWLRIAAFGSLILYHVGMFYVTWDWHVKSSRASDAIEPLMMFVNPWRLTLLFIISGVATRFMADKMKAGALAWSRLGRLFPPLLLAVFVIVPPQSYFEVLEAHRAVGAPVRPALDNFFIKYATASGHWCDGDGCLTTPTYNHMWFVAYLMIYTVILALALPVLRRAPLAFAALIKGPWLLITPVLFLVVTRLTLFPIFGETHDFRADWYLHAVYMTAFLFGFAIAKHRGFFETCLRYRWLGLGLTIAAWVGVQSGLAMLGDTNPPSDLARALLRGLHQIQAWTAIVAAFGFAHMYLRDSDGPIRRRLTVAIFPFYLVHQTIIVIAGHYLDPLALPLWLEAALLIGATLAGCGAAYGLGMLVPPLRVWLGMPSNVRVS